MVGVFGSSVWGLGLGEVGLWGGGGEGRSKQNKSHEKSVIGPFIFIRHCFRYLRCAFSGRVGGS